MKAHTIHACERLRLLAILSWSLMAVIVSRGNSAWAGSFIINDPIAGQGNLDIPGTVQPPESIFQWPYNPSPFASPFSASGQLPDGEAWNRGEIFFTGHRIEGPPDGTGYHLSLTLWGASGWAR